MNFLFYVDRSKTILTLPPPFKIQENTLVAKRTAAESVR